MNRAEECHQAVLVHPEVIPAPASRSLTLSNGKMLLPTRAVPSACSQSVLASATLMAAGIGLVLAGPVVTVVGTTLGALGVSIAGTATCSGLGLAALGAIVRSSPVIGAGLIAAVGGAALGAALTLIGSIISAAGAFLTGVGWVALALSLLLVLRRAGGEAWNRRARIAELVGSIRRGSSPGGLPEGKIPIFREEGPIPLQQLLDAIDTESRTKNQR